MRFAISWIITLATAALVVANPSKRQERTPNPPVESAHPERWATYSPAGTTNAKRFAAGLPPLSPWASRHTPRGGTGVESASRHEKSPLPPIQAKCNILVKDATNGTTYGFIGPLWNRFGEYGILQRDQTGSLEVSFSYQRGSPDSRTGLNFAAFSANDTNRAFPYMGATLGFVSTNGSIGQGLYNYLYITGTFLIPLGPPEAADNNSFGASTGIPSSAESAVWTYNPKTQRIEAQWINPDGSKPATHLVYVINDPRQPFLGATGDLGVFRETFAVTTLNAPEVTLTCVPPREHGYHAPGRPQ